MSLLIRALQAADSSRISEAFDHQGWSKPVGQYRTYLEYQRSGSRDILVAESQGVFVGYLTIRWISTYLPFRQEEIPEIVDFNVLQKLQRQGIGTALMDEAERRIKRRSAKSGIGVGVTADYAAAHILYIRRGYVPDGRGLVKDSLSLVHGSTVVVDDDLVLYLTKAL